MAAGDLSGRVALVTGVGRGIGRRIAVGLAAAGARVALVARSEHELAEAVAEIEGGGATGLAVVADVADVNRLAAVAAEIRSQLGLPTISSTTLRSSRRWDLPRRWMPMRSPPR